jgi:hypothetical protein
MPKGNLTKEEMKYLILKQKDKLINENNYTSDPKAIANKHLNELLDRIEEFRY